NAYAYEMTDGQHRDLAEVLHNVKGKVALSSYSSQLMRELYSNWRYINAPERLVHSVKMPRTEMLWTNYELQGKDTGEWQDQQDQRQFSQKRFAEQPATYRLP